MGKKTWEQEDEASGHIAATGRKRGEKARCCCAPFKDLLNHSSSPWNDAAYIQEELAILNQNFQGTLS